MNNNYKINPCHDKWKQENVNTMQSQLKGCYYPSDITIYVQEHYRLFGIPHYFNNDM